MPAKKITLYIVCGAVAYLIYMPHITLAATLDFKSIPNTSVSDTSQTIEAWVDPQGQSLNVVEGTIHFQSTPSDTLSAAVTTDNSILTVWPTAPSFNTQTQTITFTGGIPGSFSKKSLLFSMKLISPEDTTTTLSLQDGAVYLDDGNGTSKILTAAPFSLEVSGSGVVEKNNPHVSSSKYGIIILVIVIGVMLVLLYVYRKKFKK